MTTPTLGDLQETVQDTSAFTTLQDYLAVSRAFIKFVQAAQPTRIVSPSHPNYIFYQYGAGFGHRITRPLNADLFVEAPGVFESLFERVMTFLADLRAHQTAAAHTQGGKELLASSVVSKVVYTVQQAIGSIGDSFESPNQSRKRIGQLFETLVKLMIQEAGLQCESRRVSLPIRGYPGYEMAYELDLVFSRQAVVVASETSLIHPAEVVGSVKTTSKDRLDKVFLDKHLLSKLLGRDVPVVAIFLHDVQRARRGNSIFGVNSTFKTNHFLGYTVALSRLDGVYYVDRRPEMISDARLCQEIHNFQTFLARDLWTLSER